MFYTHALARLTVNGEAYVGLEALPSQTVKAQEHHYKAAEVALEMLQPTGWIIVTPESVTGDAEVFDAALERGVVLLENGNQVYAGLPKQVKVIKA